MRNKFSNSCLQPGGRGVTEVLDGTRLCHFVWYLSYDRKNDLWVRCLMVFNDFQIYGCDL